MRCIQTSCKLRDATETSPAKRSLYSGVRMAYMRGDPCASGEMS